MATRTRLTLVLAALTLAATTLRAQTTPTAFPVPITTNLVGAGAAITSTCSVGLLATDGVNYGDGCNGAMVRLSSPQGAAVDSYGNIYISDYSDRLVRVIYKGGASVAAAITAANSGYVISSSRNAPAIVPVVGNIYTIAGVGANLTIVTPSSSAGTVGGYTATASDGKFECANYTAAGQSEAIDSLGDGCPGAAASIGARDVAIDADNNLIITDYTNNRIRILCVNCTNTLAAALIKLENPGVTPVNGNIYTVAGYTLGYRDQYLGFGNPSTPKTTVSLLRSPTAAVVSAAEDIFVADNTNNAVRVLYNGGTPAKNILTAEGYTPVAGNVYTIAGAACAGAATTAVGYTSTNECTATAGTDVPTQGTIPGATPSTVTATTGASAINTAWTVYLDANSNVYYTDATNARVKVIYAGIANPLTLTGTLHTGYTYSFAGQGTQTTSGIAPSAEKLTSVQGVGGDSFGNIFFIDYTTGLFYETYASNGITAIIGGNTPIATPAVNATCNGATGGPAMTDAHYNGCPMTQVAFSSPRGPLVADNAGNLYYADSVGYFLREFTYNPTFPITAAGTTSAAQPYAFTSATTVAAPIITEGAAAGPDFIDAGNDTCPTTTAATTCVINVAFKPSAPGIHAGAAAPTQSAVAQGYSLFSGIGTGAALNVDPGTSTTTGTTLSPTAIAVDGASRVYITDAASNSVIRYTGTAAITLATGFTAPTGVAVDGAGNTFVADSSTNKITEISTLAPTTPFTFATGLGAPHGLTTDANGNLYVADTNNNRILIFTAPNKSTIAAFTGLVAPQDVAVDLNNSIYAIDSTHIVKLTTAGVQTTVATTGGTALAVDTAGNVLATRGTTLTEYPASTAGVSASLTTTLTTPKGIALDSVGNAYIADSTAKGFLEFQRTAGYYKFTNNPDSTTIELTSAGTAPVTSTAFTQTETVDYTITPATTNGCSGALAPGANCALTAQFAGTSPCVTPDSVTFTTPVANGAPGLTLTSASVVPCLSLIATPASIIYGATETLTANVSGTTNVAGSVTFSTGGTAIATQATNTTGVATYSYQPVVGMYAVLANFTPTGASSPTLTSQSAAFTVNKATPSISITPTTTSGYTSTTYPFTVSVTAPFGTPTQTVTFYYGTTQVGTATLTNGSGSVNITGLPAGTDCIKATYNGDSNFLTASTPSCTNLTVAPGFGVTATSTALAFTSANYQEAQTFLAITPGGRTDTLSFACNGLPAKLSCTFSPATLALSGLTTNQSVQLLISNSSAHATLEAPKTSTTKNTIAFAAFPLATLLLFGLRRRRISATLLAAILFTVAIATLTGCGNSPKSTQQSGGTYPFTVTVSNGTTTLQTINFTITVPSN